MSDPVLELRTLTNRAGASVSILNYGATVTALRMPDRSGQLQNVVLGFADPARYLGAHPYFGAMTGRVAGRIGRGELHVEGRLYLLTRNENTNHLHGGAVGFDRRFWKMEPSQEAAGGASVRLRHSSPDGEEGYPGNLDVMVTYNLTAQNELIIETEAQSDRTTPLSMNHHSYFNLAGEGSGSVRDHLLEIRADAWVPTDDDLIVTGRRTPLTAGNDFTRPRRVGEAIPFLPRGHGDLYVLPGAPGGEPRWVARLTDPGSGRIMNVLTNETCLQLYTATGLDGSLVGPLGSSYGPHAGICLECQGYPDGPGSGVFGDIMVRPDRPQRRRTVYAFSV